ncbi:MAG: hypothetical protein WBA57_21310 [Elainellaceae cyanobacterium]
MVATPVVYSRPVPSCWSAQLGPAQSFLSGHSVVGFSGSRHGLPSSACQGALACALSVVAASGAAVFVGCARGVDSSVRSASPGARVFRASEFGSGARSFALRSEAFVRALAAEGGALVAFPGRAAPSGLYPCQSWPWGVGSGSWGSIALAVGLGVPVLLWVPRGVAVSAGRFRAVGGGWFVSR